MSWTCTRCARVNDAVCDRCEYCTGPCCRCRTDKPCKVHPTAEARARRARKAYLAGRLDAMAGQGLCYSGPYCEDYLRGAASVGAAGER